MTREAAVIAAAINALHCTVMLVMR